VIWSVSNLVLQPDAQWSQILAAGWQPTDERFAVFDASGTLTIMQPGGASTRSFSLKLYVGSAHWQQGYGTVLVSDWSEG